MRTRVVRRKRETGQAAILLVLAMSVFLLGAVGLAIDGSHLYAERQMAQAAADAAAGAARVAIRAVRFSSSQTPPRRTNSSSSSTSASDCCVVNSRGRRLPDAERQCTQAILQAAVISHVTVMGADNPPCKKCCEPRLLL